jgi:hypothetical protein
VESRVVFGGRWGTRAALVQLRVATAFWKKRVRIKHDAVKTEEVPTKEGRIMVVPTTACLDSRKQPGDKKEMQQSTKLTGMVRYTYLKKAWLKTG